MDFFEALWNDLLELCGDTVTLGTNNVTTLNIIVWSLFIGFVVGIVTAVYNKLVLGPVIDGLIKNNAHSEAVAITLGEVGCVNPFIRFALRKGSSFRRVVKMCGDTEVSRSDDSPLTARFYLPEENIRRAKNLYAGAEMSLASILISVIVFFVIAVLMFTVVPNLITMFANFIGSVTPDSNII